MHKARLRFLSVALQQGSESAKQVQRIADAQVRDCEHELRSHTLQ